MKSFLLGFAAIAGVLSIVPLMVWGGTGSWRQALHALKVYLQVIAAILLLGGGLGLVIALGA